MRAPSVHTSQRRRAVWLAVLLLTQGPHTALKAGTADALPLNARDVLRAPDGDSIPSDFGLRDFSGVGQLGPGSAVDLPPTGSSEGSQSGGLSGDQRNHISYTALFASVVMENSFHAIRRLATLGGVKELAKWMALLGPEWAIAGTAIAVILSFVHLSDPTAEFLQQQFAAMSSQVDAVESATSELTRGIEAAKALQTYLHEYQNTRQIQTALQEYLRHLDDQSVLDSFVSQCTLYPPEGFLDFALSQLTPDGSCRVGVECILDPVGGINADIHWSVPAYMQYLRVFVGHFVAVSQLASACAGAQGASKDALHTSATKYNAQLQQLISNLRDYHDQVLAQGFWKEQFGLDVNDGLNSGSDNEAIARSMQDTFSQKYTHSLWSVAVWDEGTGSDLQGLFSRACNADPPPSTCTATGGAYYKLRQPLRAGGSKSFMIFFSPESEGPTPKPVHDKIAAAADRCSGTAGVNGASMVVLTDCMRKAVPDARAVLCVKFGMGLRARVTNLFFDNRATQFDDERDSEMGAIRADGPMVSFVVLSA